MAIVDLTNFDPTKGRAESNARLANARNQAITGSINAFQQNLQRGIDRRNKQAQEDRALRDREYALINKETDQLVQQGSNDKVTDLKLQQLGQQFKTEYYDAVKAYEDSDKGDEARAAFEQAKSKGLTSARTISKSVENLDKQVIAFQAAVKDGGVSEAVNPAVRGFMADMADPNTPEDLYQIEDIDGELRYVGETSDGHPVNFSLEDIANGANSFSPLPKANMPDVIANLTKNITGLTKQQKNEDGVTEITDWEGIGNALEGRLDQMIAGEDEFRQIAAGLGYSYDQFQMAKNGEPFADSEEEGQEIQGIDGFKTAVKRELMQQVESVMQHKETVLQSNAKQTQEEIAEQKTLQSEAYTQGLTVATQAEGVDGFNQYVGKEATVNGLKGQIAGFKKKGNIVELTVRSGQKGGAKKKYDTSKPEDMALLQSTLHPDIDYSVALNGVNKFNQTQQADMASRLHLQ